jgi:hypothetical protein
MKRITSMLLVAGALALGSAATQTTDAHAQVVISGGVGVTVGVYPPAAYIATATPEYYEGRPAYYYNNSWYYRDHGRWSYYRHEPVYLRGRRDHWVERRVHERVVREPVRYHYRR